MRSHREAVEKQSNEIKTVLEEYKVAKRALVEAQAEYESDKREAGVNLEFGTAKTRDGREFPGRNAESRKAFELHWTEQSRLKYNQAKCEVDILEKAFEFNRSVLSAIKSASDEESFEMEWADA